MKIDLPLDGTARSRVAEVSKGLYGSKYFFEAILLIAQVDRFYATQIADTVGCKVNYATKVIDRLQESQLIERLSTEDGQLRHYYRRLPYPLWDFAVDWAHELLQPPESGVARLPTTHRPRDSHGGHRA
jgi:hypothetical protein